MRGSLINQPCVVKYIFSGSCIDTYYLIVVPNKLIIVPSKKCKNQIMTDSFCVEPESFATIHYKEGCVGHLSTHN